MTISHADRLDQTIDALKGDITKLDGNGIDAINAWRGALERNGKEELQPIIENLDQLKDELEGGKLNGQRIGRILKDLGEQTTEAAEGANDEWRDRIRRLGDVLSKAGNKLDNKK
jgi:hypothetical protein